MEEKKETWLNYLALITVIIALGATLSTLRVGSFSSGSILKQTQASNQWSYFQAKSITVSYTHLTLPTNREV